MKENIKGGKNVSVGDITVINEGVSLEEKIQDKEEEKAAEIKVPETEVSEIKPDVVVGAENNPVTPVNVNEEQSPVVPIAATPEPVVTPAPIEIPIPEVNVQANTNTVSPSFDIPTPDANPQENTMPTFEYPNANNLNFNNSGFDNKFTNNSRFGEYNAPVNQEYPNESYKVSGINSYQNNFGAGDYSSNSYSELSPKAENAINTVKLLVNKNLDLENKIVSLERENEDLRNQNNEYANRIASLNAQLNGLRNTIEGFKNSLLANYGLSNYNNYENQIPRNNTLNDNLNQRNNGGMNMPA